MSLRIDRSFQDIQVYKENLFIFRRQDSKVKQKKEILLTFMICLLWEKRISQIKGNSLLNVKAARGF